MNNINEMSENIEEANKKADTGDSIDKNEVIAERIENIKKPGDALRAMADEGQIKQVDLPNVEDKNSAKIIDIRELTGSEARLDKLAQLGSVAGLGLVDRESLAFDKDRSEARDEIIKRCMSIDTNLLYDMAEGNIDLTKQDYELMEFMTASNVHIEAKITVLMHALIPKEKLNNLGTLSAEDITSYKKEAIKLVAKFMQLELDNVEQSSEVNNLSESLLVENYELEKDNESTKSRTNGESVDVSKIYKEIKEKIKALNPKDLNEAYNLRDFKTQGIVIEDVKALIKALKINGIGVELNEITEDYMAREILKVLAETVSKISTDDESNYQLDALRILYTVNKISKTEFTKSRLAEAA